MRAHTKSAKKHWWLDCLCVLFGFAHIKSSPCNFLRFYACGSHKCKKYSQFISLFCAFRICNYYSFAKNVCEIDTIIHHQWIALKHWFTEDKQTECKPYWVTNKQIQIQFNSDSGSIRKSALWSVNIV